MKTITLNIIKKNRVYFKCTHNGYEVKLMIDDKSNDLELGTQDLLVDDVSVRTKYGTDVIYKLHSEIKKDSRIITLSHFLYNENLVKRCRDLGGRWDSDSKTWVFSEIVENEIEELDFLYNSDLVNIEIKSKDRLNAYTDAYFFAGYALAKAWGRDSGAKLCDGIIQISGKITSTGSMKNWYTTIYEESIFRLQISKNLLEKEMSELSEEWEINVLK